MFSPAEVPLFPKNEYAFSSIFSAFVLFLHKTLSLDSVYIKTHKGFFCSKLEKPMSFREFEGQISLCDPSSSFFSFSEQEKISASIGIFVKEEMVCLFYNVEEYPDLFVKFWKDHLENILDQTTRDPSLCVKRICFLSEEERFLVLDKWQNTARDFKIDRMIHQFLEEQAINVPNEIAVSFKDQTLSYKELNDRSNQLAQFLRSKSITKDSLVAICMERSLELVIGLVGILKAGGAYVPMDPSYPDERLVYILKDSQASILLSERSKHDIFTDCQVEVVHLDDPSFLDPFDTVNPPLINSCEDLCYVIYTSGSTGKPKGAANIHKGVVNRIVWMQEAYGLDKSDKVLQKTPFGFDVSVWEFFWPLMNGATLVLAEPGQHKDPQALAKIIQDKQITHLHFVPSMLDIFLDADVSSFCKSLKMVFTSGEALAVHVQNRFFEKYQAQLHNLYGPTEASIDVTFWQCFPSQTKKSVPIGHPIANTQIYILDEFLQPVPVGVAGELFIGGVGLARGYIHKPDLTKEKFIDHPFKEGEKLYRSGDLCRFFPDGSIEYLGRLDHQVKIRGFRIELEEIEHEIKKHPFVKSCIVVAKEDAEHSKYLCAYIIAKEPIEGLRKQLLSSLSVSLPEFMIPEFFLFLESFPLSPNGKLDIKQLPYPQDSDRCLTFSYVEPNNALEKQLQGIWQDLFKRTKIGIKEPFFAIGGHSLLAIRLVLEIKKRLKKQIELLEIFQNPTIERLSELLSSRQSIEESVSELVFCPQDQYKPFPLTEIQSAYLLGRTNIFDLGGIKSHIYVENEKKDIEISKLERSLNFLIQRHPMLRAVIHEDGSQEILQEVPYYYIQIQDKLSVEDRRKQILEDLKNTSSWPFFHVSCSKTQEGTTVVHFFFDLLIADGTGLEIFFEELSQLYKDEKVILRPLSLTYRDVILSLDKKSDSFYRARQYWFERIDSFPEAPELPQRSVPLPIPQLPFVRRKGVLSAKEWQSFQSRASSMGVTVATLLITVYAEIIKTWSKSPHFLINLMFFNRPAIHPEIDRIVGNFSTTLLLEVDLSKKGSIENKAQSIQSQLLKDLEHSQFNGIKVLNEINRRKGGFGAAAVPVVFACALNLRSKNEQEEKNDFKWYGTEVRYSHLETPQVWLDHQVYEDHDGSLCFFWDVRENYFPEGMIEKMFCCYLSCLKEIANHSKQIAISIPKEDLTLSRSVNSTDKPYKSSLLHTAIIKRAKTHPDVVAVKTSGVSLTYGKLRDLSKSVCYKMFQQGIKPGGLIAILMKKGWEQVVAALAILESGNAYVPIDPDLPEDRIMYILKVSEVRAVVSQKEVNRLSCNLPWFEVELSETSTSCIDLPEITQDSSDLAYVIFTSGSTGTPKGVMIEHQAALNTIEAVQEKYCITEKDRAFAISSLSFDLSVFDVFGLLSVGGSLYIPTQEEVKDPKAWLSIVREEKITIWNSAPALMQVLMDSAEVDSKEFGTQLRLVMMSGDWIPVSLPSRIKRYFPAEVVSLGGATEASIWSNDFVIDKEDSTWTSIPYGKPLPNQTMEILDDDLNPRPVWTTGMIYIGGKGLARGYLGDEEKTKSSFVFDPKTQRRLYRTGDLGRLLPDGNIEFLGREDLQVKIQGYRIELEEIEAVFRQLPEIQQVIVRIIGKKQEAKRIAAFYILKKPISVDALKEHLQQKIPFYMVPNHFVALEKFPLNSNGKIDLKSLFSMVQENNTSLKAVYEKPVGYLEESLSKIWSQLLSLDKVGRFDNFFSLGGTSFLAFQMMNRAQKELGLFFSLSTLFQKGSIAQLISEQGLKEDPSFVVLNSADVDIPLFFVHPSGGGVLCYTEMAQQLKEDFCFYAFQAPGFMDDRNPLVSIEELARHYLQIILKKQPRGPYFLGGWSLGGVVCFEIASILQKMGHEIGSVFMIDSPSPVARADLSDTLLYTWFAQDYGQQLSELDESTQNNLFNVFKANIKALSSYQPRKQTFDIILLKATRIDLDHLLSHPMKDAQDWGWSKYTDGHISCHLLDADHNSILKEPHLSEVVYELKNGIYGLIER